MKPIEDLNKFELLEIVERLKKLIDRQQDMFTPEQLLTVLDGKERKDEW